MLQDDNISSKSYYDIYQLPETAIDISDSMVELLESIERPIKRHIHSIISDSDKTSRVFMEIDATDKKLVHSLLVDFKVNGKIKTFEANLKKPKPTFYSGNEERSYMENIRNRLLSELTTQVQNEIMPFLIESLKEHYPPRPKD